MRKILLSVVLVLFIVSFASAVSPFKQQGGTDFTEGYIIEIPQSLDNIKVNTDYNFHIHVFNLTTGFGIRPSNPVSCIIHMYNDVGSHILQDNLEADSNAVDFKLTIDKGNFTTSGTYSYIAQCNSSRTGGFIASSFIVSNEGEVLETPHSIIYSTLFLALIFLLITVVIGIFLLPSENDKGDDGMILNINNLKYLRIVLGFVSWGLLMAIMFISSNLAFNFLNAGLMANVFWAIYRVMMILTLPIVVVMFIWIFVKIFQDSETKRMIERGIPVGKGV